MTTEWTVYENAVVEGWVILHGSPVYVTMYNVWVTISQHGYSVQTHKHHKAIPFDVQRLRNYDRCRTYTRTESNVVKVVS